MKKFVLALMALLLAVTLCGCSSKKEEDAAPAAKSGKTAARKEPEIVEGAEYTQSKENPDVYYLPMTDGTVAVYVCAYDEELTIPTKVDGHKVSTLTAVLDYGSNLKRINIPDSVVRLEGAPFTSCPYLKEVIFSPNHPSMKVRDGMLLSKDGQELMAVINASQESYVIPEGIQRIGDAAFFYCSNLKSVVFPESLTAIGDDAFAYTGLTEVEIPRTVTELGANPFLGCAGLKGIKVAQDHPTLAVIDGVLFRKEGKELICYPSGRTGTTYAIPDRIQKIGDCAFEDSKLEEIVIPASVTSIGDYAFSSCDSLTSIALPAGVTSIGDYAFSDCYSLTSITLPASVTSIGDYAFYYCRSLADITLPAGVTSIGDYAFSDCDFLTSIALPAGVTSIGDYAFSSCASLTDIAIPDSVTRIGANPFAWCKALTDIIVSTDHSTLSLVDGVLFDKAEKKLICYPYAYTNTSYVIPQGIRVIGDSAFSNCVSLTSINIPESVTSIGRDAFNWCYDLTLTVNSGSYAQRYCEENDLEYTCTDALDWLYN